MAIVPISHDREFECRAGASELCRVIELVICDRAPESTILIFFHTKRMQN